MRNIFAVIVGSCLLLAACAMPDAMIIQTPTPASAAAGGPGSTPGSTHEAQPEAPVEDAALHPFVEAALDHAPAGTEFFAFTNWVTIKRIAGVERLTSQDPLDARLDFMLPLGLQEQALGSLFANAHFLKHAENWGWDNTDLLWEASLTTSGPPVYLLRFRDDFDFAPVFARLDERGYALLDHGGIPLYSHEFDLGVDWLRTSEFAVLNIAFVEAEKLFVMASTPESVTAVLDTIASGSTLAALPAVRSVAAALGDAGAIVMSPLGCQPLDVAAFLDSSPQEIKRVWDEWQQQEINGLYTVFALGYRVEQINGEQINGESVPLGIFVHHYPLAAQAHADLEPRRQLAENGQSLSRDVAYAELFDVVRAEVMETGTGAANLVLALAARERSPQLFFQMVYSRDIPFSACGG